MGDREPRMELRTGASDITARTDRADIVAKIPTGIGDMTLEQIAARYGIEIVRTETGLQVSFTVPHETTAPSNLEPPQPEKQQQPNIQTKGFSIFIDGAEISLINLRNKGIIEFVSEEHTPKPSPHAETKVTRLSVRCHMGSAFIPPVLRDALKDPEKKSYVMACICEIVKRMTASQCTEDVSIVVDLFSA